MYVNVLDVIHPMRLVRSMKRATVFRDDYTHCDIAQLKQHYTVGCSAWGGGVSKYTLLRESRYLIM